MKLLRVLILLIVIGLAGFVTATLLGVDQIKDKAVVEEVSDILHAERRGQSLDSIAEALKHGALRSLWKNTEKLISDDLIILSIKGSRPLLLNKEVMIVEVRYLIDDDKQADSDEHKRYFRFLHSIDKGWVFKGEATARDYWLNFLYNVKPIPKKTAQAEAGDKPAAERKNLVES